MPSVKQIAKIVITKPIMVQLKYESIGVGQCSSKYVPNIYINAALIILMVSRFQKNLISLLMICEER